MSDPFLDHLPSGARERIRRRMRSPEAYEKLREKVKGPEDLEREMEKNDRMAEVHLSLESDPEAQEQAKEWIQKMQSEDLFESEPSKETLKKIQEGKFKLSVQPHPATHEDVISVMPEGTVQEHIPLQHSASDQLSKSILQHHSN